jgi:hypothetical protein
LRFYKDEAEKSAALRLLPFWPVFEKDGEPAKPASLKIEWKVEKTDKLKAGQIVVTDRENKVVFRKALGEADLKKDKDANYEWDGNGADGKPVKRSQSPFRVQIQAHSDLKEEKGVALAAMHTEVRLFVHPTTGSHKTSVDDKLNPWKDKNSLVLRIAPVSVKKLTKNDGSRWVAERLHELGYHPGPLADALTGKAKKALSEFQRSNPLADGTTWKRVTPDGSENDDTKTLLETPTAGARAHFGKHDASRADIAKISDAEEILRNPDGNLIVWVDDRHVYTEEDGGASGDAIEMGNYRGGMSLHDERVQKDVDSITRPAIPVEALVPLLRRTLDLAATDPFSGLGEDARSKMQAAMAAAVGPLRVDWTFDEIGEDYDNVADADPKLVRTKKYLQAAISDLGVVFDPSTGLYDDHAPLPADRDRKTKKYFTNAPASVNGKEVGIRPGKSGMGSYYKAAFTCEGDDTKLLSLEPWFTVDDGTAKAVCTAIHDDVGQAEDLFHATRRGRSGVYLHPSRVAGDGYRFRAQLSLEQIPGGSENPNKNVLKSRYAELPQAHTAALRIWRKASYRGYVPWLPAAQKSWDTKRGPAAERYAPAFLHFVHEGKHGIAHEFALTDFMTEQKLQTLVQAKLAGTSWANKAVNMTDASVWPFQALAGWGFDPELKDADAYIASVRGEAQTIWRKFREALLNSMVTDIETAKGILRGHLIVEFESSPRDVLVRQYECNTCHGKGSVIQTANQTNYTGQPCFKKSPQCAGTLEGPRDFTYPGGLMLNAVGGKCGAAWLFADHGDPRKIENVWAHEMGHHRHLQHAPAWPGKGNEAPGAVAAQHDDAFNPAFVDSGEWNSGADTLAHRRWGRTCIMSYTLRAPLYFCGKCALKNRGWAVETMTDPDGGILLRNLKVRNVTRDSATVSWDTSAAAQGFAAKPADSKVEYGTSTTYGHAESDATEVSAHSITLTGLSEKTEYHVRASSKMGGDSTRSCDLVFKTGPVDVTNVGAHNVGVSSARIRWRTDRPAKGEVQYGEDGTYGRSRPQATLTTVHEVVIPGLKSGTEYHYQIVCRTPDGIDGSSGDETFRTH